MISNIRHTYHSDIFTGAAVEFNNQHFAHNLPSHLNVWPVHHRIRQQAPFKNHHDDSNDDSRTFVPQDKDTIKILTQANNKYQSLKSNGSGIKIGIIDSGVDYTLAALGGCFGKGCKIAYGHDLVGNNFNGSLSSIKSSNDPMDDCPANSTSATGHGTFVTGIIAAEDKEYNWNGVAPGATIGMWRVYGCNFPTAPNDIIIKAMEMAYEAKMDVISISLGVSGGWAQDVLSVVADRLVAKGIHVITASGNIGTSGVFLTASPATGKDVIAVGSTMNDHVPGYILKLYNQSKKVIEIAYRTYTSTPFVLNLGNKLPIVSTGKEFNAENDACLPLHKHKYNGTIALIHQGGNCTSLEKVMHARNAGAVAAILYSNIQNATTDVEILTTAVLPIAFINNDDAKIAFEEAKHAEFTKVLVALKSAEVYRDSVASFSTLGPTNQLELKPELMAVGGDIFSTLPRYLKSYGFRSGTSFSTPYVAGTVALLLSNTQPDMKPDMVKHLLMNFASQVKEPISAIHYGDSPIRQGAGVVDVSQAIGGYERFHVSPAKLSFNDTAHFIKEHVLTVYNHDTENEVTFRLSHSASLTATGYSMNNKTDLTPTEPVSLYGGDEDSVASVQFSLTKLVVPAGQSVQVRVRIQPPTRFTSDSHAMYGGYLRIHDDEKNHEATVPYIGMKGNMLDLPILDRSTKPSMAAPYTFPAIGFTNGTGTLEPQETGHFHIRTDLASNFQGPYVLVRLLTGTSILQIQVLNKYGSVIGDMPTDGSRTFMMRNTLTTTEYTNAFYTWNWNGVYVPKDVTLSGTNGGYEPKIVKSGEYRLKVRGLRVYGKKKSDWDEWISPRIQLKID
ncbi:hypothetical protein INT47_004807 [Mucor saturninus]|uniref:Uncharacterized protein n=1 Tax=Mucor saturninus TaxID=64648 RepID=A0A8H7R3T5_9FUNG|nr:hypothetical protein INT47_004807 [Mucor saturninus]